jgi:hypothetical protein
MASLVGLCRRVERHKQKIELWPQKWSKVDSGHPREGMRSLCPDSVDFVLTDPPYIVRYRGRDGRDGRTIKSYDNDQWLAPAFADLQEENPAACLTRSTISFGSSVSAASK